MNEAYYEKKYGDRESREWWAVADDDVIRVTGYSCAPSSPNVWWCPKAGYSMTEGHHLFNTEIEAVNKLIDELRKRIEVAHDNVQALELRKRQIITASAAPKAP